MHGDFSLLLIMICYYIRKLCTVVDGDFSFDLRVFVSLRKSSESSEPQNKSESEKCDQPKRSLDADWGSPVLDRGNQAFTQHKLGHMTQLSAN
jgi:hypothetical protein